MYTNLYKLLEMAFKLECGFNEIFTLQLKAKHFYSLFYGLSDVIFAQNINRSGVSLRFAAGGHLDLAPGQSLYKA